MNSLGKNNLNNFLRLMSTEAADRNQVPKFNISFNYSGNKEQDPPFLVVSDDKLTPTEKRELIKMPILSDATKKEMYRKHVDDGIDVVTIAQQYSASVDRVKAVIVMMESKENYLRSEGLLCYVPLKKGEIESEEDHQQREQGRLWEKVYNQYTQIVQELDGERAQRKREEEKAAMEEMSKGDRRRFLKQKKRDAKAAQKDVKQQRHLQAELHEAAVTSLTTAMSLPKETVETAVAKMKVHFFQTKNLMDREENVARYRDKLLASGIVGPCTISLVQ